MKNSKKGSIVILVMLHLLLLVYSLGGIFSKYAAKQQFLSLKFILFYGVVLFILFFYALAWQQIIKRLPLIVAYANKAVTIIWGVVWGILFFQEKITVMNVVGAVIIIAGIYLVVSDMEEE